MRIEVGGRSCDGVSTDTRTLRAGQAFVALAGPNHDGHDHVAEAFRLGAPAAVVAREVGGAEGAQHVVPDPLEWLQQTAARAREGFRGRVVAITGSAGKTTTKDAAATALSPALRTGKTSGNFNNHIGVPLSVLNLSETDEAAVLEIGMNHAGEIRALAAIARPEIGVVTNVGTAHIESFDSIEGIAAAKRELVEALPASGIAILNGDDPRVRGFAGVHGGRTVLYGAGEGVDLRARDVAFEPAGVRFQIEGEGEFQCPLPARGGLSAALAALAVAREFGVPLQRAGQALAAMKPPKMRFERMERDGLVIWNDCYNSNPEAAEMMLDLLAATPAIRRIAVLGEMLELGRWSESLHRGVGVHAARCGLSVLVGIRGAAKHLVDAARGAGLGAGAAIFFDDPSEAGQWLRRVTRPGDALLFKGSRGVRVEQALEALLN
jgi:UDP-N-acetylmuramoyl-tripeptide--D-alanyl-D-alanine ligase